MSGKPCYGKCPQCHHEGLVMPLHGEKGGPLMCLNCGMEWHAKHTRRRKFGRVVAKALRLYFANGGRSTDAKQIVDVISFESLGIRARELDPFGYGADSLGTEIGDITAELLADILQLTHPDHHPPERRDLANRVTQDLLALKPFVFPAPKPKPAPTIAPKRDTSVKVPTDDRKKPSQPAYPCPVCAEVTPYYYCAPCRAEYEKLWEAKRELERAKNREQYARRQRRRRAMRPPKPCEVCGAKVEAKRKDAKHCSPACRQRAHRARVTDKNLSPAGTASSRNGAECRS